MSKINEILNVVQSGARTNKYRVIYPILGQNIDILCNATSAPGADIGTAEVFLRGRKYQLAGDRIDDGTWEMTIYNTPDMLVRNFFLKLIDSIQSYKTPQSFSQTVAGLIPTGNVNNVLSQLGNINTSLFSLINQVTINWNNIYSVIRNISDSAYSLGSGPWYMTEIIIQQLDHEMKVTSQIVLEKAFIKTVGNIDYSDETGNVSTTTFTFAYSGIRFGTDAEQIAWDSMMP